MTVDLFRVMLHHITGSQLRTTGTAASIQASTPYMTSSYYTSIQHHITSSSFKLVVRQAEVVPWLLGAARQELS